MLSHGSDSMVERGGRTCRSKVLRERPLAWVFRSSATRLSAGKRSFSWRGCAEFLALLARFVFSPAPPRAHIARRSVLGVVAASLPSTTGSASSARAAVTAPSKTRPLANTTVGGWLQESGDCRHRCFHAATYCCTSPSTSSSPHRYTRTEPRRMTHAHCDRPLQRTLATSRRSSRSTCEDDDRAEARSARNGTDAATARRSPAPHPRPMCWDLRGVLDSTYDISALTQRTPETRHRHRVFLNERRHSEVVGHRRAKLLRIPKLALPRDSRCTLIRGEPGSEPRASSRVLSA